MKDWNSWLLKAKAESVFITVANLWAHYMKLTPFSLRNMEQRALVKLKQYQMIWPRNVKHVPIFPLTHIHVPAISNHLFLPMFWWQLTENQTLHTWRVSQDYLYSKNHRCQLMLCVTALFFFVCAQSCCITWQLTWISDRRASLPGSTSLRADLRSARWASSSAWTSTGRSASDTLPTLR